MDRNTGALRGKPVLCPVTTLRAIFGAPLGETLRHPHPEGRLMVRILYLYAQTLRVETPHARQTLQMLALLRSAGIETDLLTLPGGDPWPQGLADRIYRTARVPFARTLPPYGSGPRRWWVTLVLTFTAIRLFLLHRYDAIHCADRAVRAGSLVAWLFGAHFVFEWHTASGHDLVRWLRRRSRNFRRAVSLVLSDVPYSFARLRETGIYGRIATIPLLPTPAIRRLPAPPVRLLGAAQPFRLVALSQVPRLADLSVLCDALPELLERPGLHVTLYGGTPGAAERLRETLMRRLPATGIPGTVEVRPAPLGAADLTACLTGADLVFLPAVNGPLPPPVLLDVMAAQRAILAIRCPAAETLLTYANAVLVPSDAQAVADAVLRHVHAPLLCAEHAVAAADTVERERNASSAAAALRSCYAFALSEGRR